MVIFQGVALCWGSWAVWLCLWMVAGDEEQTLTERWTELHNPLPLKQRFTSEKHIHPVPLHTLDPLPAPTAAPKPPPLTNLLEAISNLTSTPSSSIETLDPATFDPRNEYSSVIDAAATAAGVGKKAIKVFRVELGRSRCEYWVVGLKEETRVVGFRAKAVET